ncbi:hybrid sensor histidine kinase/response regulator [Leptothoe spongobia]|uniref:Circadian input-output histidine kinase CikA n=1 Tax=Leptothoe spongobia TAU-MAC 1115 TaxID=1967444 RepID=A0A947DB69_9CYAN|nr:hybrid sensor histidine kinase/response regulator [Leptothoe spongobia]MBT9314047.1 AAA family ATPase [Leptothoe spongobia TAU-MAC 1115]
MLQSSPYHIHAKLHESAHALVYRATMQADTQGLKDKTSVIIKQLRQEYPPPKVLARFRQEYDIIHYLTDSVRNQSDHDHATSSPDAAQFIIQAYGLEPYGKTQAIILEDFGGESLRSHLKAGPMPLQVFLPLAIKIAQALGYIHNANVIHKDINPANIVFNAASGQVKIIDFGIATQLPQTSIRLERSDVVEGTLAYISPEQTGRMNRFLDYRTDFYSLGVTFYELLTQRLPFWANDRLELLHQHLAQAPPSLQEHCPEIPTVVANIVSKLLQKTAEDRYQSAQGLQADLERCLDQLETTGTVQSFTLASQDRSHQLRIPQKLYGRSAEVDQLLQIFDQVTQTEKTALLLVTGKSGIGKSALVQEIHKPITERKGYFITGKFNQLQRDTPYSAVTDAFKNLIRLLLTEDEARLQDWKAKLTQALGKNGQVIVEVIPDLALILGPQPAVAQLGPTETRNRFNLVFQRFIQVFSDRTHPLVIFLDDLQWADTASLQLIQLILTNPELKSHLLIGAYRDNEVSSTHPLMHTLQALQDEGLQVHELTLSPLSVTHIQTLLTETFRCDHPATVLPLAQLITVKTNGNPFFINEFLKTLATDNLLYFSPRQGQWQWDIPTIQAQNITDNVVELMMAKLQKLPHPTQQVLWDAACIGTTFELHTLTIVSGKTASELAQSLMIAVRAGLILTTSDPDVGLLIQDYRFLHDRVHQAAYDAMDDTQKQQRHLSIGQLLKQTTPEAEWNEKLPDIVRHLNLGRTQNTQADFPLDLAQLNLKAAQKAKGAIAYEPAHTYLCIGLECLPVASWQDHYPLTLALHQAQAEVEYLLGNFDVSRQILETVLEQGKTVIERAEAYNLLVVQSTVQTEYAMALEYGRQALKLFDIDFPEDNFTAAFNQGYRQIQTQLGSRSIRALIDLPEIVEPEQKLAVKILSNLGSAAYRYNQTIWQIVVVLSINLFLKYGNVAESCYGYSNYGTLLGSVLKNYGDSYDACEVALALSERYDDLTQQSRACFILSNFVHSWVKHVNQADAINQTGAQAGLESGELQYVGYTISYRVSNLFFQGKNLEELATELQKSLQFCRQHKNQWAIDALRGYELALEQLLTTAGEGHPLLTTHPDGETYGQTCQANKSFSGLCRYYILQAIVGYLAGQFDQALNYARQAKEHQSYILGVVSNAELTLYTTLILMQLYPDAAPQQQTDYLAEITTLQQELQGWADSCPDNFLHKVWLVEAELARLHNRPWHAYEHYDRAISAAAAQGFVQEEGLTNELAARFWLAQGKREFAQSYLRKAQYAYQLWGAQAKVKQLQQRYPNLLATPTQTTRSSIFNAQSTAVEFSLSSGTETLDFQSLLKATQSIGQEIVLEKLLSQLMTVVMENAGAQTAHLILETQGQFTIEATGEINTPIRVLMGVPLAGRIPMGLFNYVVRTQNSVVLANAIAPDAAEQFADFAQDPYIQQHQLKSVLCTPLVHQGKLIGVLYLENNLVESAFTHDRLQVLSLLSTQIAISLENSQLYTTLEQKVAERTVELKFARDEAEMASQAKGKFLANMSHELRTPLNSIIGFSQIMARDADLTETHQKRLNLIRHSGEHLLNLINDILELSKLEAGKQPLNESLFEIGQLTETIQALFQLRVEQKGLQFFIETAPDVPHQFIGDEKKIRQVLLNLLSNALKFTNQGHIGVRVRPCLEVNQPCLEFSVEDTGEGIAADELPKLFVPFEQTDSGTKSKTGTGLGLSISEQFVKLMGGEFRVTSQLGQGTVFAFTVQSQSTAEELESLPPEIIPEVILDPAVPAINRAAAPTVQALGDLAQGTNDLVPSSAIIQALSTMPAGWLTDIKQASQRLNGRQVMKLLDQLPESDVAVANHLKELAENYDYAQLTALLSADLA